MKCSGKWEYQELAVGSTWVAVNSALWLAPRDRRKGMSRTTYKEYRQAGKRIILQVITYTTGLIHVQPYTVNIEPCLWVEEALEFACPKPLCVRIEPVYGDILELKMREITGHNKYLGMQSRLCGGCFNGVIL